MNYSAIDIAKWFLNENRFRMNDQDSEYLTCSKLQNLLYYAQGCYLMITGKALFEEDILAWEQGAAIKEVYQVYKNCAQSIEYNEDYDDNIDNFTRCVLYDVFEVFGRYSTWKLRRMVRSGKPWEGTKRNQIIDKELIKSHFKEVNSRFSEGGYE